MANFEEAIKHVMAKQRGYMPVVKTKKSKDNILCSNCFKDEGLRINAEIIGITNKKKCPKCNSTTGKKLTKELVRDLCYIFFVRGTIERPAYGGFPLIEFNEQHYNQSEINVSPWLTKDVELIEQIGEIGLFYYGPRFWMFGEIEPLKSLQNDSERNEIIESILRTYPVRELTSEQYFYRIRINPGIPHENSEYDSAPETFLGKGRFDKKSFPILYGSQDLEVCIHECRVTAEDNVYVSKLRPLDNLKLLDLTEHIEEEGVTEFESIDIAIHFLFLAGKHSYEICREIAYKAFEKGFDGIIYPSYFSYLRTGKIPFETVYGMSIRRIPVLKDKVKNQVIPDVALFGRPLLENKLLVECINRVVINRVQYDITFGPAYHTAYVDNKNMDKYKEDYNAKTTAALEKLIHKNKKNTDKK